MTFTSVLPKMGQSKSTEKQDTDETNSTEVKTRETKSGSLFCSNWNNVGFCSTINVNEPADRQIEEKSNETSNVRDQSSRDSVHNLIDYEDDSGRDSNSLNVFSKTTTIASLCDSEQRKNFAMPSTPYKERSDIYLSEKTISSDDSIIISNCKKTETNSTDELKTESGKDSAFSDILDTEIQHIKNVPKKNYIPGQIEINGLLRRSLRQSNIRISNSQILGVYKHVGNRNGYPCYQHSEDTWLERPCLWLKEYNNNKKYWVISPVLGKDNRKRAIRLRKMLSKINTTHADRHEIETPWNHTYDWDENFSIQVKAIYRKQKGTVR